MCQEAYSVNPSLLYEDSDLSKAVWKVGQLHTRVFSGVSIYHILNKVLAPRSLFYHNQCAKCNWSRVPDTPKLYFSTYAPVAPRKIVSSHETSFPKPPYSPDFSRSYG